MHFMLLYNLCDCIDKLCSLTFATGDTCPVCHGSVHQLSVTGDCWHQIPIVSSALGTPNAAKHCPQLCWICTSCTGAHKIFCLSWKYLTISKLVKCLAFHIWVLCMNLSVTWFNREDLIPQVHEKEVDKNKVLPGEEHKSTFRLSQYLMWVT